MDKEKENGNRNGRWAAMLGFALGNPEGVLAGYALAAGSGDPDLAEMAGFLKDQAIALGVTETQLANSLEAMRMTNELLGDGPENDCT